MKKLLPLLLPALCALWVVSAWRTPSDKPGTLPANAFGRLPVIANGRVQPLDSLARNSLLQIREKQTASTGSSEGKARILSASEWLLELFRLLHLNQDLVRQCCAWVKLGQQLQDPLCHLWLVLLSEQVLVT
jgi:hypothetical protein